MRVWRENNPEKVKESYDKWRKANPEKVRIAKRNRAIRKKLNGCGYLSVGIFDKLHMLQKGKCAVCRTKIVKT